MINKKIPMIKTKKTITARKKTNLKMLSVDALLICFSLRSAALQMRHMRIIFMFLASLGRTTNVCFAFGSPTTNGAHTNLAAHANYFIDNIFYRQSSNLSFFA